MKYRLHGLMAADGAFIELEDAEFVLECGGLWPPVVLLFEIVAEEDPFDMRDGGK